MPTVLRRDRVTLRRGPAHRGGDVRRISAFEDGGGLLVDTITTIAAASGVRKLQAMVLASNQRSRRLLSLVGLEVVRHDGGVLEAEGAFHLLERPQVNRSKVVRLAVPACPAAA